MARRWCDDIPPATALVSCGGDEHRVTWRRGKLVLEDHDLEAERTMLLLGGEPCACLRVLHLWRDLFSWAMSGEIFRQMESRLGPGGHFLAPGDLREVHELALLLTWQRRWRRSAYFSDHERLLREQLRKRALGPLRDHLTLWRQRVGSRLMSSVDVSVARPDEAPSLEGSMDRVKATATARLGVDWLLRVWARGLAVVSDAFVLEVEETNGSPTPVVRAVRWEEEAPGRYAPVAGPARLGRDGDGGWRLTWVPSADPAAAFAATRARPDVWDPTTYLRQLRGPRRQGSPGGNG